MRAGGADDGRGGGRLEEGGGVFDVGVAEEVDLVVQLDIEDGLVDVHGARAEEVEDGHVLHFAREARVEVVRPFGARLTPFLPLCKEAFIDRDYYQLWQRLRGLLIRA